MTTQPLLDVAQVNSASGVFPLSASPLSNTQTQVQTGLAVYLKANTTRLNQSSLTNEANMTLTINETGIYKFDCVLNFTANTGGKVGIILDFGGGTIGVSNTNFATHFFINGTSGDQITGIGTGNGAFSFSSLQLGLTGQDYSEFNGILQVTAPGTLILRYAQNFANTGQTVTMIANSTYMMATKIG